MIIIGDGVKDITIENIDDGGSATATIIGWIEDTDTDPSI